MTNKRQKLDIELLRLRNQSQPEKAKESLKPLITKYSSNDPALRLVENEIELEICLLENEPVSSTYNALNSSITTLKNNFQDLTNSDLKNCQFNVAEESSFLLVKIHYLLEEISQCLQIFEKFELPTYSKEIPLYKKRMLSEMYAIKGLCCEQKTELKQSASECYEVSINFLIHYLSDYEKTFPSHVIITDENLVSFFSETAIYRSTVIYIKTGKLWTGVKLLRRIMKTLHAYLPLRIQQVISCKLALILLRGTSSQEYIIDNGDQTATKHSISLDQSKKSETAVYNDESLLPNNVAQFKPKFYLGEKLVKLKKGVCLQRMIYT